MAATFSRCASTTAGMRLRSRGRSCAPPRKPLPTTRIFRTFLCDSFRYDDEKGVTRRYLVADSRYALLAIIVLTSATHLGSLVRARRAGFVTLAALTASIASAPPPPPSRWSLAPPWAPVAGRSEPPTSIRDLGGRAGTACCTHAELKSGLRGGTAEAMMTVDDLSLFRVPLEMICAAVVVVTPPPPPPPPRTSH